MNRGLYLPSKIEKTVQFSKGRMAPVSHQLSKVRKHLLELGSGVCSRTNRHLLLMRKFKLEAGRDGEEIKYSSSEEQCSRLIYYYVQKEQNRNR